MAYKWIALAAHSLSHRMERVNGMPAYTSPTNRRDVLYYHAMANYVPPKLNCDVIAVACERGANSFEWSTKPWTALASTVRHVVVPGEHRSCITDHVEALAQSLNAHLVELHAAPALSTEPLFEFQRL